MYPPRRTLRFITPFLVIGLLIGAVPVAAQTPTGTISGTVADSGGAPLPGATVTARNVGTGAVRTAVSAATGSFTIVLLQPGAYDVSAELQGFESTRVSNVKLDVGGDISLKLTLKLGATAEVVVTTEAPLVETTRSQVSSVVNENFIQNLPTNGRNFIDFVTTTPGVALDRRGGDISFAGQRGTLNSLVVDGADNNNTFFGQALGRTGSGRAPYQFSQDAVAEFQVNSNAYSAEYGRAGGAVINVVTKSGTNDFHGAAFDFFRDKSLRANDRLSVLAGTEKGPFRVNQFGATLGGPIVHDRVFFFANYDGQRQTIPQPFTLNLPASTPNDAATLDGIAKLSPYVYDFETTRNQNVFLLKTDVEVGSSSRLSLRYNRQDFTGQNNENSFPPSTESHSGDSLVKTDTVTASYTSTFSSTFANELRGQYARDSEPGLANSTLPEATVSQSGSTLATIGRNNFSPRETTITRYQVADTATLLFDKHTVKVGFDLNWDKILNFFPGLFGGSYSFSSLAAFSRGIPTTYTQNFAGVGTSGPTTNPDLAEQAFFVQDEYRVTNNLTLNLGLRYDRQGIHQPTVQNPDAQLLAAGIDTSVVPEDTNNIAGRFGFAWSPDAKTVVRGGYGMFYGRTPAIMISTAISTNGVSVISLTFTGNQVPTYPNVFAAPPTGAAFKPNIFYFDKDYQNPLVQQGSLGVERAITNDVSVALSYLWVRGEHLQRSIDYNVGAAQDVVFTTDTGEQLTVHQYLPTRPFTNFGRVVQFQSGAESRYNGLTLEVNKRFSHNWQMRLAYTYSKVLDTNPDGTAVVIGTDDNKYVQDPLRPEGDYGVGQNDTTHRVVLSGVWNISPYNESSSGLQKYVLGGWSLSGIITAQAGQPYSATVNNDPNNDGNSANDRAPGFARDTFNLPYFFSVDPRITKDIPLAGGVRLQLIAECFNLFNRNNVLAVRQGFYARANRTTTNLTHTTNFGVPTRYGDPRTVQLAAKIVF